MSAIMGSLLVILGAFGFSVSLCLEYRMRLMLLKQIRGVYEYMEFQISYGKLPIPEILRKLSFKDELCFRQEFGRIAQRMEEGGQELAVIWKEELGPSLRKSGLKKKEQEWLLAFPLKQGFLIGQAQAESLGEIRRELEDGIQSLQQEQKSRSKVIMSVGELGLVHRHELSGALHGLFRVRCFTQDDAHIFMTWDQMKDEIKNVVRLFDEVYSTFGLTYQIELSTMPEDHMGELKDWQFAEKTLAEAITEIGKDYVVNEGDGAFYGPKLDFHLADSIGRTWQCGTIQLDMQLPERFELEYTGADGEKHRPVMIHRVVLGSIERFIGVITEHFAGAFPTWLAPEQVRVMPMTDRNIPCAQEVMKQLTDKGFRATMDERNEKIGYKIREAQVHKVPYMIVIGDKDEEKGIISVRNRKTGETTPMELSEFIEKLDYEVKNRLK